MNVVTIIAKKCRKEELTDDEMKYFVQRTVDGCIDQCQIGKKVFLNKLLLNI